MFAQKHMYHVASRHMFKHIFTYVGAQHYMCTYMCKDICKYVSRHMHKILFFQNKILFWKNTDLMHMSWHIITYVVTHTYICCNTYFHMFRHNIYICFDICWRWCVWYTDKCLYVQSHMFICAATYVFYVQSHMFICAVTCVYMCSHMCLYVQSHMFLCAVTYVYMCSHMRLYMQPHVYKILFLM